MSGRNSHDADDRYSRPEKRHSRGSSHDHQGNKRRKHRDDRSLDFGMSSTLARLQQPDLPSFNLTSDKAPIRQEDTAKDGEAQSPEGWQTAEGQKSKKPKKIPKAHSSNYPSFSFSADSRLQSQIKISDLQGLLLYVLADGTAPQWIAVRHRPEIRKVVVLMVPGLEKDMFIKEESGTESEEAQGKDRNYTSPDDYYPIRLESKNLPNHLKPFADMFEYLWPVKTPGDDKWGKMHSPLHAMLTAPLSKSQEKQDKKGAKPAKEPQGWQNRRTRITEFISLPEELLENDYTLHPATYSEEDEKIALREQRKRSMTSSEHGWVDTDVSKFEDGTPHEKDIEQGSLTAGREILAMDCEMCMTGEKEFSLTRISIVSWDGTVVLDELVKPDKPITDYVTQYSGITEAMLAPVTMSLRDIQEKLVKILHPKTILLGHSLNSDLTALKLTHPFIIDTALLYPHPRGPPLKSSLKWLAQKYLGKEIQKGSGGSGAGAGHDSIEDARTCLDLVKQKCEKGPQWGTSEAAGENLFKRLARTGVRYKNQGGTALPAGQTGGKSSATIDWGDPKKGPGASANVVIGCKSDDDVTQGVIRAVKGDPDGLEVPGGGVEFVWARMRELEALKGWWNSNRNTADSVTIATIATPVTAAEAVAEPGIETKVIPTDTDSELKIVVDQVVEDGLSQEKTIDKEKSSPIKQTEDNEEPHSADTPVLSPIDSAAATLTSRIHSIYESLPPCTAFIVYSGSGDPREMSRLQTMQQTFKREYKVKKWDQLSVKWTDTEEQALKKAVRKARDGVGFLTVK